MTHSMMVRTFVVAAVLLLAVSAGGTCWSQTPGGPATPQQIAAAMKSPMRLEFVQTPLSQILEYITNSSGVPIQVDRAGLAAAGISPQIPVTISTGDGIRVGSVLLVTLRQVGLVCVVQRGGLLVTTPAGTRRWGGVAPGLTTPAPVGQSGETPVSKKVAESLDARTDLQFIDSPLPNVVSYLSKLHKIPILPDSLALFQAKIDPSKLSVTLSVKGISLRSALLLLLDQYGLTCAHQDEFLMITTPQEVKYWGGPLDAVAGAGPGQPLPAEKLIAEALEQPTQLEFIETPLTDVVAYLQDFHSIAIVIDRRSLDQAGISAETPITRTMKDVPLSAALELMLDEFKLAPLVKYEVLLITTQKRAGIKAKDPAGPGAGAAEGAAAAFRIWKDSTGAHSIEAEFAGVADGKVQLRKKDGSTVAVPLDRLSAEDQQWVRRQR